ncbi:LOG family protein, partial [Klebsiella sp. K47]
TWAQLGIHLKPNAFLNVNGFYDDLLKFLKMTTDKGFTHARFTDSLIVSDSVKAILKQMDQFQAPEPKWGMVDPEL